MTLKIRTRILLYLFAFGSLPLLLAAAINLPLVLDRVELFFRHAVVQDMRRDFADLETHLASRDEMIRLLSKLPEPGLVMGTNQAASTQQIDQARVGYTKWINRIFSEQFDVVDILFMDKDGVSRFWLSRDPSSGEWTPALTQPKRPPIAAISGALTAEHPSIFATPVLVDIQPQDIAHAITLQLLSPLGLAEGTKTTGAVAITLDIGGLIRRDVNTLWVQDDGSYLALRGIQGMPDYAQNAFNDFKGLEQLFSTGKMSLWQGEDDSDYIWLPLLRTADDKPLWVGRLIRDRPLAELTDTLILRVLSIIVALVAATWLMARWGASRIEHYGTDLINGIQAMLEKGEPVNFNWHGSPELQKLGRNLSDLAHAHAANVRNLRAHARELEESNRYKNEFMANVSHELRTPLNSILLLSKILSESSIQCSGEQRQQIDVIHQASRDLRKLIDDVLDLSRIESGLVQLNMESIDLPQLIDDLKALMQPQCDAKGLPLMTYIADDTPHRIISDGGRIRQILKNFLSNAIKFTEKGSVQIHLKSAETPYGIRVAVQDTGIGIPADKQGIIFEAFRQADGSTQRKYGGTGLGLNISRKLAEMMGGRIEVKSKLGKGSVFSLLLPLDSSQFGCIQPAPSPQPEPYTVEQAEDALPIADLSDVHVLIAEPDLPTMLDLSQMLSGWGASILGAADAQEALDTLEHEPSLNVLMISSRMTGLDTILKEAGDRGVKPILLQYADTAKPAVSFLAVLEPPVHARALLTLLQPGGDLS